MSSQVALPLILDGLYFEVIELDKISGKVKAKCKLCEPKEKIINGSLRPTSNFTTHLKVRN
jgi:hypothetical protein